MKQKSGFVKRVSSGSKQNIFCKIVKKSRSKELEIGFKGSLVKDGV